MCEYCGCQAVETIRQLTDEHELVVNLIGDVRSAHRAGDRELMRDLARRISAVLVPHTAVEEEGLFPALDGDFHEHIDALIEEHRVIDAALAEAAAGTAPGWERRLLDALGVLRQHILAEQDGVFPAALANLGTPQWEAIEAVRARVGTLLPGQAEAA
ncbi:hemerythrin domain-containing protein [Spirillospora albida]|uniref:hemerythrin domain-containing protein n=1 Tax=Spirillospora albida TaxID=58123 RepID=UPI0004C0B48E|nr:hemerythrin domain-containing protein [Spirillospora albida]